MGVRAGACLVLINAPRAVARRAAFYGALECARSSAFTGHLRMHDEQAHVAALAVRSSKTWRAVRSGVDRGVEVGAWSVVGHGGVRCVWCVGGRG
eukprot:6195652-Pleurochrysis_carterae.AAC.1